jgi:hypothetical protein
LIVYQIYVFRLTELTPWHEPHENIKPESQVLQALGLRGERQLKGTEEPHVEEQGCDCVILMMNMM